LGDSTKAKKSTWLGIKNKLRRINRRNDQFDLQEAKKEASSKE